jgi:replication factor C subunit 2/4
VRCSRHPYSLVPLHNICLAAPHTLLQRACHTPHRIIEPITSRCSKFRFKPLDQVNTKTRLEYICEKEGVHYAEGALDALIKVSEGDLRRAITFLQSGSKLHATSEDPITPLSIHEIAGIVPDSTLAKLVEALGVEITSTDGDLDDDMALDAGHAKLKTVASAKSQSGFAKVRTQVERIVRDGYSAWQILSQVSLQYNAPSRRVRKLADLVLSS